MPSRPMAKGLFRVALTRRFFRPPQMSLIICRQKSIFKNDLALAASIIAWALRYFTAE